MLARRDQEGRVLARGQGAGYWHGARELGTGRRGKGACSMLAVARELQEAVGLVAAGGRPTAWEPSGARAGAGADIRPVSTGGS